MKKLFIMSVILLVGCTNGNTPIKATEEFFKKYQTLDSVVLEDLNQVVEEENSMTQSQKEKYTNIMKKQYQNLVYNIKEESLDGDEAVVTVDIEVIDFNKALDEATLYLGENPDEFLNEFNDYDSEKFMDYKLNQMENYKEKVAYTLYIPVEKIEDTWKIGELSDSIYQKINGSYDY